MPYKFLGADERYALWNAMILKVAYTFSSVARPAVDVRATLRDLDVRSYFRALFRRMMNELYLYVIAHEKESMLLQGMTNKVYRSLRFEDLKVSPLQYLY
jgi:hypothetical protein